LAAHIGLLFAEKISKLSPLDVFWRGSMADIPLITRIVNRRDGQTAKWPVLVFLRCETEDGPVELRITGEAAHDLLRVLLDKPPPKIGPRPVVKKLS
jgi:hypothetical protein